MQDLEQRTVGDTSIGTKPSEAHADVKHVALSDLRAARRLNDYPIVWAVSELQQLVPCGGDTDEDERARATVEFKEQGTSCIGDLICLL